MNRWKVMIVIALAAISQIGIAMAAGNPDTGPGCGLGKKLWEDWKGQKQILPQLLMSSTNVAGSYSFAITSGTSGCSNDGRVWNSERVNLFIGINYASLSEDMARGGGEHLTSLATLLHLPQEYHDGFFASVQKHYVSLADREGNVPTAIQEAVSEVIATHPVLAKPRIN